MANNVYIGSRYVPIFDGTWDNTKSYEALVIVEYGNNTYTSKKPVPAGTLPTNNTYWALTGNYNGQINNLQKQIDKLHCMVNVTEVATGSNITSALNTILGQGKIPYIPSGSYSINSKVFIPDGLGIYGAPDAIVTSNTGNDSFGMGDNTFLKGFKIYDSSSSGTYSVISIPNKTNVDIINIKISNAYYIGIGIHLSKNVNITGCTISTRTHDGIARYKGPNSFINGNSVNIIGNTLENIGLDGISFGGTVNIVNNRILNCGEAASAAGIYGAESSDSVIRGNLISATTGNGIDIAGDSGSNIHNKITENRVQNTDGVGILLKRGNRNIIEQNFIYNTGRVGSVNGGAAISVLGTTYNTLIQFNYVNGNPNSAFYLASTVVNAIFDTNDVEGGTTPATYASDGSPNYYTFDKTAHTI